MAVSLFSVAGIDLPGLLVQRGPIWFEQIFINPMADAVVGIFALFFVASLLPSLALSIRRLHDIELNGWWYLGNTVASALPLIGIIFKVI
jgi:uncharacterized membrane protein YhaH (DUF805 family)